LIEHILADWPLWGLTGSAPELTQVKTLPGGLTNQCFLLTLDSGQYVLRAEGKNSAALDINRDAEYLVHQLAAEKKLTPPVIYRSPDKHYWIRPYVSGRTLLQTDLKSPLLEQMLTHLQSLHNLAVAAVVMKNIPRLSVSQKAGYYWNMLTAQHMPDRILDLRSQLQPAMSVMPDERLCLCHMDPLPANWIANADGELILLDWEYATMGHPLWDIAALMLAAELSAEDERHLLTDVLKQEINSSWQQAKRQMQYLSALWYGAQGIWPVEQLQSSLTALLNDAPAVYF